MRAEQVCGSDYCITLFAFCRREDPLIDMDDEFHRLDFLGSVNAYCTDVHTQIYGNSPVVQVQVLMGPPIRLLKNMIRNAFDPFVCASRLNPCIKLFSRSFLRDSAEQETLEHYGVEQDDGTMVSPSQGLDSIMLHEWEIECVELRRLEPQGRYTVLKTYKFHDYI